MVNNSFVLDTMGKFYSVDLLNKYIAVLAPFRGCYAFYIVINQILSFLYCRTWDMAWCKLLNAQKAPQKNNNDLYL